MCADKCESRAKAPCDVCRTINLAKTMVEPRVDMQIAEKCIPDKGPCLRITELPLHPTPIRVCTREEYRFQKAGGKLKPLPLPPIGHGKLTYLVKAGILMGSIYFTYSQGVWGDQRDVAECIKRWQEYVRSLHTRTPPSYDKCGNVVYHTKGDSIIAPIYSVYKTVVTTIFSGIVKFPVIMKCWYFEYMEALRLKRESDAKARK